jgi:hypothetical protein
MNQSKRIIRAMSTIISKPTCCLSGRIGLTPWPVRGNAVALHPPVSDHGVVAMSAHKRPRMGSCPLLEPVLQGILITTVQGTVCAYPSARLEHLTFFGGFRA